ncbi:stage 0 sporulation family protein [Neolewinella agarilytica]|uniref:PSP1 domain-containing protein n=1 Tax=Neolewinella agarilytica TaxID=478744 RepID=UPI002352A230|nr:regulatory iron-sulfur-containing complex subunit RicT [Neolewinella agarilytica]
MGCKSCGSGTNEDGTPKGCGSKGACNTSSCNQRSTYDWLSDLGIDDPYAASIVEVSFKNGASKDFYYAPSELEVFTGDNVAVETKNGYNVGRITLSGELVRLQMKKKKVREEKVTESIIRRANTRDMERLAEVRDMERSTLVKARAIARSNHSKMKITDVEFQGDGKKATIYYTCDERVDFRELVRQFSHQFRIKIEMRQIGPRQESARLGGIGSCGRELCCSTWLSDFSSVNTAAARYQNIAINQAKLSGQCGRLKCCLNYELDTYMEALEVFPKKADKLRTEAGLAILIKTDIFKGIMYYTYKENRGLLYPIPVAKVHEILAMNKAGDKPIDLQSNQLVVEEKDDVFGYEDVTGAIELPAEKRRKKRRKKKSGTNAKGRSSGSGRKPASGDSRANTGEAKTSNTGDKPAAGGETKEGSRSSKRRRGRSNNRNKKRGENASTGPKASSGGGDKPANKPSTPKPTGEGGKGGSSSSGRKKRTPRRKKRGGDAPKGD